MSDTQKRWLTNGVMLLAVLIAGVLGVIYPMPESQPEYGLRSVSITEFRSVLVDHTLTADDINVNDDLAVTGLATVGETLTVTGAGDFASTLQYGADNLYPLGYASSGYQAVCGTTGVFTDSTDIAASALTTATYALVSQITKPAATGELLYVSAIDGYTVTVKSLESDYTVGTTGVNAYYCIVGNQ